MWGNLRITLCKLWVFCLMKHMPLHVLQKKSHAELNCTILALFSSEKENHWLIYRKDVDKGFRILIRTNYIARSRNRDINLLSLINLSLAYMSYCSTYS